MSETENLTNASEPKTNDDEKSCPSLDSNTLQEDEKEQSDANNSGDIDMHDAEWIVQDEVHSDEDSENITNGDLKEKQDNVEKLPSEIKENLEIPSKIEDNSIEGMDIDLDNNASDNSIVVQEEEEDALLEDKVETEETASEALVSIEVKEPNQSEAATNKDNINVESKDLVSNETVSNGVENVTSSSGDKEKTDSVDEMTNVSSAENVKCNMSEVISLDEETMSETEKPDSTLIEDSKKCVNIDDDDDDIMLVDNDVENIQDIAKLEKKVIQKELKDDIEIKDEYEVKPDIIKDDEEVKIEVAIIDEDVKIEGVAIDDNDVKNYNLVKNDKDVEVLDVAEIPVLDKELDQKVKNEDIAEIDNDRFDDTAKSGSIRNDNEAKTSDFRNGEKANKNNEKNVNDEKNIDDVKINDKAVIKLKDISKLGENDPIDHESKIDVGKVNKKDNYQIDKEVNNLDKSQSNETQIAGTPSEEVETAEILSISETDEVEDKLKVAEAEKTESKDKGKTDLSGDNCKVFPENEEIINSTDPELKIKSSNDEETFNTDLIPSDCDVPLSKMVEGLDEKTIIFIDDVVKSGFKNVLISDQSVEKKPLIQKNFIKSFSKKLSDMTRDDLEEFCLLKIVEGVVERSTLSDATAKLNNLMQHVDEWRKKAQQLQKQNRDLSVVLRNIQEEHKKRAHGIVTPLKITRSVGLQVSNPTNMNNQNNQNIPNVPMAEPRQSKQKRVQGKPSVNRIQKRSKTPVKSIQIKTSASNVPVPRLVPVSSSPPKLSQFKNLSAATNGLNTTPTKAAEKRPLNELNNSIDLTDDEPPSKQMAVTNPSNVMRLVNAPGQPGSGQRMAIMVNSPLGFNSTSPRQVYIPIAGQGAQAAIRAGQTLMFAGGPRAKVPSLTNPPPLVRNKGEFHDPSLPPLPGSYRQVHLPNWKWIPPSPELKISRVDTESTSIVISWMLKDFDENKHEKVVSYQIYAYHESNARVTSSASWIKIGDVKALPLPMACTLSQFKMQNKYHFVVRGVDAKSRVGPFSPPGSIVLVKQPNSINGTNK